MSVVNMILYTCFLNVTVVCGDVQVKELAKKQPIGSCRGKTTSNVIVLWGE